MVYKCSVYGCKNNYDPKKGEPSRTKIKLYRFPNNEDERNVWIRCLPNDEFTWTESKRVCIEHWPPEFPTRIVNRNGTVGPAVPPSVFAGVPPSCVPTQPPKKRPTRTSSRCREEENILTLPSDSSSEAVENCEYEYNQSLPPPDLLAKILSEIFPEDNIINNVQKVTLSSYDYDGPVPRYVIFLEMGQYYRISGYKGLLSVKVPFLKNDNNV